MLSQIPLIILMLSISFSSFSDSMNSLNNFFFVSDINEIYNDENCRDSLDEKNNNSDEGLVFQLFGRDLKVSAYNKNLGLQAPTYSTIFIDTGECSEHKEFRLETKKLQASASSDGSNLERIKERLKSETTEVGKKRLENQRDWYHESIEKKKARIAKIAPVIKRLEPYCSYDTGVDIRQGFGLVRLRFVNKSNNSTNPQYTDIGSRRIYKLDFHYRSLQNIVLSIKDESQSGEGTDNNASHSVMNTSLVFIPRLTLPYIDIESNTDKEVTKVILPTKEAILFNKKTNEIIGGVLTENSPIDTVGSDKRYTRKFADVSYSGKGIMIRADRRGQDPILVHSQLFNENELLSEATLFYQGKECRVKKNLIWANLSDPEAGNHYFKHDTDQEFLDNVVNPICKWELELKDII